jgi:hypothetical protein
LEKERLTWKWYPEWQMQILIRYYSPFSKYFTMKSYKLKIDSSAWQLTIEISIVNLKMTTRMTCAIFTSLLFTVLEEILWRTSIHIYMYTVNHTDTLFNIIRSKRDHRATASGSKENTNPTIKISFRIAFWINSSTREQFPKRLHP